MTSIIQNMVQINILTISLDSLPETILNVDIQLDVSSNFKMLLSDQSFIPASISFSKINLINSISVSLPGLSSGKYKYTLQLSGHSAAEYNVTYGNTQYIQVREVNDIPPTPKLQRAWFADDGSYINIQFDANTNKGNLPNIFSCSALFSVVGVSSAICQWIDNTLINAYYLQQIKPNDEIALRESNIVQAICYRYNGCSDYNNATSLSIAVNTPISPIAPIIIFSLPTTIGNCDDLIIDITGSTGSGGREWQTSIIRISEGINSTIINKNFDTQSSYFPPPMIPRALLKPGYFYVVQVKLCNFLNSCSTLSKKVSKSKHLIPSVSILG